MPTPNECYWCGTDLIEDTEAHYCYDCKRSTCPTCIENFGLCECILNTEKEL